MTAILPGYVEIDPDGRPWIAGTKTKVIEVVLDHTAYGFSPAEIHLQHPQLSMASIHAALAYYFDHQAELDAQMQAEAVEAERLREQTRSSPGRRRLQAQGLLP